MIDLDKLERLFNGSNRAPWVEKELAAAVGELLAHVRAAESKLDTRTPKDRTLSERDELYRRLDDAKARLRAAEAIVQRAREALDEVEWDEQLLSLGGDRSCVPCDLGQEGAHTVFDHHSVSAGMGTMLRLRRAVEAKP